MLSRRKFLAASSATLASLGIPLETLGALSSINSRATRIHPQLQAVCPVSSYGLTVAHLKLVNLDMPYRLETRLVQYMLNFESIQPVILPEAIYNLTHPTLGSLDLSLQPCGTLVREQHDGIQYPGLHGHVAITHAL